MFTKRPTKGFFFKNNNYALKKTHANVNLSSLGAKPSNKVQIHLETFQSLDLYWVMV